MGDLLYESPSIEHLLGIFAQWIKAAGEWFDD
jgi:hypothetical protein